MTQRSGDVTFDVLHREHERWKSMRKAIQAAEALGYDGPTAVEKLPELLGVAQSALNALEPQTRYQYSSEYKKLAVNELTDILAACRSKETPHKPAGNGD